VNLPNSMLELNRFIYIHEYM